MLKSVRYNSGLRVAMSIPNGRRMQEVSAYFSDLGFIRPTCCRLAATSRLLGSNRRFSLPAGSRNDPLPGAAKTKCADDFLFNQPFMAGALGCEHPILYWITEGIEQNKTHPL